jgi:hypothetical protein
MSDLHRVGDIDIAQDLAFQRREWSIQRASWLVLLTIAVLALLGACGDGLLASASTRAPNNALILRYDRLARHSAKTKLEIELGPQAGDTVGVWLDERYLDGVEVEDIVPVPESVASGNGRITYYFAAGQNPKITFLISPVRLGQRAAALGTEGGPSVRFGQFVFP